MAVVLLFLKKFWPYILAAIVIAGIYFHYTGLLRTIESQTQTIADQKAKIADQKAKIADLNAKLADCQAANSKYAEALDKVNAAADKLAEVSALQQKALDSLKIMIGKERAEKAKVVAELKDLKSKPLATTCQGAIDELVDATKNFTPLNVPLTPPAPTPPATGGVSR